MHFTRGCDRNRHIARQQENCNLYQIEILMRHGFLLILLLVFIGVHEAAATPITSPAPYNSSGFKVGAYGYRYNLVSAGWGMSYRGNQNFYHQFAIEYAKFYSGCLYRSFKGYGVNYTMFANGNYSLGIKYYEAFKRYAGHTLIPYLGVSPSWFHMEGSDGINIKPLLGMKISPIYGGAVGLDLDLAYGYEIPVIAARTFTAGRHDLSATISLSINVNDIYCLFHKEDRVDVKF